MRTEEEIRDEIRKLKARNYINRYLEGHISGLVWVLEEDEK